MHTTHYQINVILKWLKVDKADLTTWVITDDVLSLWFKNEDHVREYQLSSESEEFIKTGQEKHWSSPVEVGIRKAMITETLRIAVRGAAVKLGDGQSLDGVTNVCDASMIDDNGMHRCIRPENHRFRHSSLTDRSKPWRKWW